MYKRDSVTIANYAKESPIHLVKVARFVLSTINMHFEQVPKILDKLNAGNVKQFSAAKSLALRDFFNNRDMLYEKTFNSNMSSHDILLLWARQRGLGIVKAGFVVQLLRIDNVIGCLDRRNVVAYGLKKGQFDKKPIADNTANHQKIDDYIALCDLLGGAEKLWDNWCIGLAKARPYAFPSAEYVSHLHVECILDK